MQHWLSGYANWYAQWNRRSGPLFQGRYKSFPVEDEGYSSGSLHSPTAGIRMATPSKGLKVVTAREVIAATAAVYQVDPQSYCGFRSPAGGGDVAA